MKTPEKMKVGLREKIHRAIQEETEGTIEYVEFWVEVDCLIDSVVTEVFGENEDESEVEELCPDMDKFVEE